MIQQMIMNMNSLIIKIQLSKNEITNKKILEDDESIADFDNKKDLKLAKVLEEILFVISFNTFINEKSAFHIDLFIDKNDEQEQSSCQICS